MNGLKTLVQNVDTSLTTTISVKQKSTTTTDICYADIAPDFTDETSLIYYQKIVDANDESKKKTLTSLKKLGKKKATAGDDATDFFTDW